MVLRMSRLLLKTLRDDPADAETTSHKLLVRAGYVRRSTAGVWTWLPLGKRVLDNVARVVREEMDAIGGQELLLPALLPREPYETTGRAAEYVIAAGKAVQTALATEAADRLHAAGLRVLLDDRPGVSPGVKFADADLLGVPTHLTAGRRAADSVLELKNRRTGAREELPLEEALSQLTATNA